MVLEAAAVGVAREAVAVGGGVAAALDWVRGWLVVVLVVVVVVVDKH